MFVFSNHVQGRLETLDALFECFILYAAKLYDDPHQIWSSCLYQNQYFHSLAYSTEQEHFNYKTTNTVYYAFISHFQSPIQGEDFHFKQFK
jgi:hypothetical protein